MTLQNYSCRISDIAFLNLQEMLQSSLKRKVADGRPIMSNGLNLFLRIRGIVEQCLEYFFIAFY